MALVVVGSVAYDGVETPKGKRERILGGAASYIAVAASYFTPVHIVAVVGEDFAPEDYAFLASRGIGLEGLEQAPGKTFFWEGVYSQDMNSRTTLRTELNVFAEFNPKLPPSYRNQPYLFLGNIQPSLQRRVRAQMNGLRLAGGDTMNYWISNAREELYSAMREWDFLLINDEEARMLSGEYHLGDAARKILALGPKVLVIKRGEYGALLFRDGQYFSLPGYPLDQVCDPTGAGDCFAGGFTGYLASLGVPSLRDLSPRDLARAVVYGSVMGSFCCEDFGPERFRTLTRAEIDERFEAFRRFTAF